MGKRKSKIVLPLIIICLVGLCCGLNIRWMFTYPVFAIETDDYGFRSVEYNSDGNHIVTFYALYTRIYDIESGEEILQVEGNAPAFSPDGNYIATAVGNPSDFPYFRAIQIWDAKTGEALKLIEAPATSLQFHPDSTQLLTTFLGDIEVWDIVTGESVLKIAGQELQSIRFSPDGDKIIAGCKDGFIRVWDASTGEQLLEILANESGRTDLQALYSPDGTYIASINHNDRNIRLWDASSGKKLGTLSDLRILTFADIAISPSGIYVAGLGDFGHLVIWNKNTRLPVRFYSGLLFESRDGYATSVEFSPIGDTLAVTGDSQLQVIKGNWD